MSLQYPGCPDLTGQTAECEACWRNSADPTEYHQDSGNPFIAEWIEDAMVAAEYAAEAAQEADYARQEEERESQEKLEHASRNRTESDGGHKGDSGSSGDDNLHLGFLQVNI